MPETVVAFTTVNKNIIGPAPDHLSCASLHHPVGSVCFSSSMSTSSFQTHYSNQPGWNDCLPTLVHKKRISSTSSLASNSSQSSRSSKQYLSPTIKAPPMGNFGAIKSCPAVCESVLSDPEPEQEPETESSSDADASLELDTPEPSVSLDQISVLLEQVISRSSTLSGRELGHYKQRLLKTLPGLDQQHLLCIHSACSAILYQSDVAVAREVVVQHSLYHSGVSSWTLPLRRVVESVVI